MLMRNEYRKPPILVEELVQTIPSRVAMAYSNNNARLIFIRHYRNRHCLYLYPSHYPFIPANSSLGCMTMFDLSYLMKIDGIHFWEHLCFVSAFGSSSFLCLSDCCVVCSWFAYTQPCLRNHLSNQQLPPCGYIFVWTPMYKESNFSFTVNKTIYTVTNFCYCSTFPPKTSACNEILMGFNHIWIAEHLVNFYFCETVHSDCYFSPFIKQTSYDGFTKASIVIYN